MSAQSGNGRHGRRANTDDEPNELNRLEVLGRAVEPRGSSRPSADARATKSSPRRSGFEQWSRPCLGELVQIDGCDHEWFEDRGPRCTVLVGVDDATSRLMELRFVVSESAFDYFGSARS